MKVILLQDIEKLGKKFDVKEVTGGYARNFLIPNKLVRIATKGALLELDKMKEAEVKKQEADLKINQNIASKIDGLEVEIKEKADKDGVLFGSINAQSISKALENLGYKISKSQIKLESPIKEVGEYDVGIDLGHNLEVQIRVIVLKEDEK